MRFTVAKNKGITYLLLSYPFDFDSHRVAGAKCVEGDCSGVSWKLSPPFKKGETERRRGLWKMMTRRL